MISSLLEMAQALAHADEALEQCEGYAIRVDEYDPALVEVARLGASCATRAARVQQRIRSVLLSRGGL